MLRTPARTLLLVAAASAAAGCAMLVPDPAPIDHRIWVFGPPVGDEPRDVDPETGLEIRRMESSADGFGRISTEAHNDSMRAAVREGRIASRYADRFVTREDAATLLRTSGAVVRAGEPGVELAGTQWFVRLRGGEVECVGGPTGLLVSDAALVAFRRDGRVFLVATPATDAWTRCFVVDSTTGVHVQTIRR